MKRGYFVLLFILITIFLVNAAEAKSLKKGEVYRSLKGEVIEIISKTELEISKEEGGETIVAEYDFKGDKLRVVYTVVGTKMVRYFLLTEEGLKFEKTGEVYYSKVGLEKVKKVKEEEKKREEIEKLKMTTYTDNGNGTVTQGTGLMWQEEDDNTKREWESAISYCEGLSLGGYTDWRLPNIEELKSIIDKENRPTINTTYFPNTKEERYWSSTTYAGGTTSAWYVSFSSGGESDHYLTSSFYVRCVRESSTPSPSPDSQSKDTDPQKLKTFITDQWKLIIQIPPPKRDWRELVTLKITGKYDDYSTLYLMGLNRRSLANDALVSADKFLKKNDVNNTKKYADLATRHYIESNELFNASEQVFIGSVEMTAQTLEAMYRGPKEASKYGWYLMCGPKCYEVADYVFLMTDFAMDYGLEGMDEAKKNLIVNAFVKTLLKTSGVSKWIENRTTHLIGDSGLYGLMDKTLNSPEFQKAFMKALAESGAYTTQKMANEGGKKIIHNSLAFIKGSSNLKPAN